MQSNFDLPLIDITLSMEELEKVQEKCKKYMENVHLAFQNEEERKKAQVSLKVCPFLRFINSE